MCKLLYVPGEGFLIYTTYILVGEAPGEVEEQELRPFIGRSGKLLREVFTFLGIDKETLYFTNAVKVRPQNNRRPTKLEIESWAMSLEMEIQRIHEYNPDVRIIAVGKSAEWALKCTNFKFKTIWHPSYVLGTGKRAEWIQQIKEILQLTE